VNVLNRLQAARAGAARSDFTHADTYRGLSPAAILHRSRLRRLRQILLKMELAETGLLVDLGCSDGFIDDLLRSAGALPIKWRIDGYDHALDLIERAEARQLPGARFFSVNLNDPAATPCETGDLVLCLETLEHVGDYPAALEVIHSAMAPGSRMLVSMPNETGVIGFVKLISRRVLRSRPYEGFFTGHGQPFSYALEVIRGGKISRFRAEGQQSWGPHLGFDHREVRDHIQQRFVASGVWRIDVDEMSWGRATRFVVARRIS
jgi:2-polyprenyl-3-methyl-5-hydroxy-6-metoxy-1,4-benzoquinol methylase